MQCPYCGHTKSEVVETRESDDLDSIRRRRSCLTCGKRFTTYERIENVHLLVIKRDGRREQYSIDKLRRGILKSCEKTNISAEQIDRLVGDVTREFRSGEKSEIESKHIGDIVAQRLKKLDKVAYIRFASVFKRFVDAEDFEKEAKNL